MEESSRREKEGRRGKVETLHEGSEYRSKIGFMCFRGEEYARSKRRASTGSSDLLWSVLPRR